MIEWVEFFNQLKYNVNAAAKYTHPLKNVKQTIFIFTFIRTSFFYLQMVDFRDREKKNPDTKILVVPNHDPIIYIE